MKRTIFKREIHIHAQSDEVYEWHARSGAFERLQPPWEPVEVGTRSGGIENGGRVVVNVKAGLFSQEWVMEHHDNIPGKQFCDLMLKGPFRYWNHVHFMESRGPDTTVLHDEIEYELPFGKIGTLITEGFVRKKLERMFLYRHAVTKHELEINKLPKGISPMNILITGSHGLVARMLIPSLTTAGHSVKKLVRSTPGTEEFTWDPERGLIDPNIFSGIDTVIHLAGESIAEGRWTKEKKKSIYESRVNGTKLLAEVMARLQNPPKNFIVASAIGFFGDRGEELLNEQSKQGTGFLPDVCTAWENAALPAREKGIRVAHLRFGLILTQSGGALAKLLLPFKLGVGGVVGNGKQYWSWIAIDDVINSIHHVLKHPNIEGPVNIVAPNPVSNYDFTKVLGRVLRRPAVLPAPAFALRLALGEMTDSLLLSSSRVIPAKLSSTGFQFQYSQLEVALRHLLGK